jgi:hypothetical protein
MLRITELITEAGAKYVQKSSQCSLFVACEEFDGLGNLMPDKRRAFVENSISEGNSVRIIQFAELLAMIGTTEEELDLLPLPEDASGTPASGNTHKKSQPASDKKENICLANDVIGEDEVSVMIEDSQFIEDETEDIICETV